MPAFICNTCGTQYEPSDKPPSACPICDDERQFVPPPGQSWITLDTLQKRYTNGWRERLMCLVAPNQRRTRQLCRPSTLRSDNWL